MSVITTGAHPKALWPGVYKWINMKYNEHPLECAMLFNNRTSDKKYEEMVEATGFGMVPQKPEGGAISYYGHNQGPTTRFYHVAYGMGFIVTYEELQDNMYPELSRMRGTALAFSFRQTKETVGANILNRGFDTNFPIGDGAALFSASHPVAGGGVQSNVLSIAADLSEASVEDLMVQIALAQNNQNLKIALRPQKLVVAPANMFEAERIVNSNLRSGTGNNDLNAIKSMSMLPGGVMVYHYLDDADAFYITTDAPDGLTMFTRSAFSVRKDNDFDTINAKTAGYERYSFGVGDWRHIYGSAGA